MIYFFIDLKLSKICPHSLNGYNKSLLRIRCRFEFCWGRHKYGQFNEKRYTMKNKAIKIGIIASILPHLFCCVLPIVLALIGLFAPEIAHSSFIPEWIEPWLFVFSALMLGLSWVLVIQDCPCSECGEEKSHKKQSNFNGRIFLRFDTQCPKTCFFTRWHTER